LLAVPAPCGTSVSLLLPPEHGVDDSELELADLEPMWEPDDWTDCSATFEAIVVSSTLAVRPLPQCRGAPACAEVRLLEHPHAFLTTAAGKLHASTLNVLELLTAHASELGGARRVLDMGCGSGVLSLAALALASQAGGGGGDLRAYGVDVHEPAISAARRNALLNGCGESAQFGYVWDVSSRLEADVAVANMMPGPLISVASDLITRTRAGGLLLISGFREADVPAVRAALEPHFSMPDAPAVEREGRADEAGGRWIAYVCRRTSTTYDVREMSESAV